MVQTIAIRGGPLDGQRAVDVGPEWLIRVASWERGRVVVRRCRYLKSVLGDLSMYRWAGEE